MELWPPLQRTPSTAGLQCAAAFMQTDNFPMLEHTRWLKVKLHWTHKDKTDLGKANHNLTVGRLPGPEWNCTGERGWRERKSGFRCSDPAAVGRSEGVEGEMGRKEEEEEERQEEERRCLMPESHTEFPSPKCSPSDTWVSQGCHLYSAGPNVCEAKRAGVGGLSNWLSRFPQGTQSPPLSWNVCANSGWRPPPVALRN